MKPPAGPEEGRRPASDIRAFASSCTLHGLGHVFGPGGLTLRRGLWAVAVLLSLAAFLYQVAGRVRYYGEFHYETALDERESHRLTFPAVTLCNINPLRRSRLTPNDLHWAGPTLLGLDPAEHAAFLRALGQPPAPAGFMPSPTFDMAQLYARAGHSLDAMLLDCRYRGQACGPENFTAIFTRMGQCYTFNSGAPGAELLTTPKGGVGNGLEIMLDVQQEEYLPVWKATEETPFEAGFRVQIHSQEEPPVIDQLGFGAAPGYQTFVSCQQQQLSFLPPPWGDCTSRSLEPDFEQEPSDPLGAPSPSPSPPYSLMGCRLACETRYVARKCGCRMVHMPGGAPVCSPQQYKDCANSALDAMLRKDACACPSPCAVTRYAKELSMVRIPSRASARYLARKYNRSEAYIAENVLVLDIFFEALNYETVEQKAAYEVSELLSVSERPGLGRGVQGKWLNRQVTLSPQVTLGARWGCSSGPVCSPSLRFWTTSVRCSEIESWAISGTKGAPEGTSAPTCCRKGWAAMEPKSPTSAWAPELPHIPAQSPGMPLPPTAPATWSRGSRPAVYALRATPGHHGHAWPAHVPAISPNKVLTHLPQVSLFQGRAEPDDGQPDLGTRSPP